MSTLKMRIPALLAVLINLMSKILFGISQSLKNYLKTSSLINWSFNGTHLYLIYNQIEKDPSRLMTKEIIVMIFKRKHNQVI